MSDDALLEARIAEANSYPVKSTFIQPLFSSGQQLDLEVRYYGEGPRNSSNYPAGEIGYHVGLYLAGDYWGRVSMPIDPQTTPVSAIEKEMKGDLPFLADLEPEQASTLAKRVFLRVASDDLVRLKYPSVQTAGLLDDNSSFKIMCQVGGKPQLVQVTLYAQNHYGINGGQVRINEDSALDVPTIATAIRLKVGYRFVADQRNDLINASPWPEAIAEVIALCVMSGAI